MPSHTKIHKRTLLAFTNILKRIIKGPALTFEELSNAVSLYSASQCCFFFHLSPPNTLCMPFIRTACITLLNGCPCQWFLLVKVKYCWIQNRYPILNISFLINSVLRVLYCFVLTDRWIDHFLKGYASWRNNTFFLVQPTLWVNCILNIMLKQQKASLMATWVYPVVMPAVIGLMEIFKASIGL